MKKKKRIFPYVAFTLRVLFDLGAVFIAVVIWMSLKNMAHTPATQLLCLSLPAIAVIAICFDIRIFYKDLKKLN